MKRRRMTLLVLVSLVAMVPGNASADHQHASSSSSTLCSVATCAVPFWDTHTFALPAGSGFISPYCAYALGLACAFSVQTNPAVPYLLAEGIVTETSGEGGTLEIVACNNISNPAVPKQHCPNSTRVTVMMTLPHAAPPEIFFSDVCLTFVGDALPVTESGVCVSGSIQVEPYDG